MVDQDVPFDFDAAVIGSSPLMLLQAQKLVQDGKSVCILERQTSLGGAWRFKKTLSGDVIEVASHLIEVFPGVYEALERASGVSFEPLDGVPIRVTRSGRKFKYFSRFLVALSGVRLTLGYFKSLLSSDRDRQLNFQAKFRSYRRHQLSQIWNPKPVQGPVGGYAYFIDRLVRSTEKAGVIFRNFDVQSAKRQDGCWFLRDPLDHSITAKEIHCTTSTNLTASDQNKIVANPVQFALRYASIVSVRSENLISSPAYVAFWRDDFCPRVSRIDTISSTSAEEHRFLVELVEAPDPASLDFQRRLDATLIKAGIISSGDQCSMIENVQCEFVRNTDQFQASDTSIDLFTYHSSGNLAAGIADWLRS